MDITEVQLAFSPLGGSSPNFASDAIAFSYVSPSWTPPTTGGMLVLFVANYELFGDNGPPGVSGNGVTWLQRATVTFSIDFEVPATRLTMFVAHVYGATAGAITIDFGALQQDWCIASLFYVTGADLKNGPYNAFQQVVTGDGGGFSGSLTLASPFKVENRPLVAFAHMAGEAASPDSGWSEMNDTFNLSAGIETQVQKNEFDTSAAATWASFVNWGGIAAEIKVAQPADLHAPAFSSILHAPEILDKVLSGQTDTSTLVDENSEILVDENSVELTATFGNLFAYLLSTLPDDHSLNAE